MPSNNTKTTREQRERILEAYLRGDHDAAQTMSDALGLRPGYAYHLAMERGLLPRTRRHWGRLRETRDGPAQ